jgi:hypothetical protein
MTTITTTRRSMIAGVAAMPIVATSVPAVAGLPTTPSWLASPPK